MRLPRLNRWLIAVLVIIFLLRLPSLFEPYWYGDEGIYLILGQTMQRGAVLYRDIWDNKPPLLYMIYALHPTLLWAKVSATLFVLATVFIIYKLAQKLISQAKPQFPLLVAFITGVLLSLPLLEGTIANAELYFVLPITLAAYLLLTNTQGLPLKYLLLIGTLFTSAFLLKVPAVFDFLGMFLTLSLTQLLENDRFDLRRILRLVWEQTKFYLPVILPFTLIVGTVTAYFYSQRALSDFLTASFSQNASYVAVGSGPLSKLSNPLFLKALILLFWLGLATYFFRTKRIGRELLFLSFWFAFSLYGALLSNRPYLHYLLQIVPAGTVLFFYLLVNLRRYLLFFGSYILLLIIIGRMFTGAFALDTVAYYKNFLNYVYERETWTEYVNNFDPRTANSYAIGNYLASRTESSDPIFVWGDASFVYVLSNRPAATKFIQAHHLSTIDPKNYNLIINRLEKYQPKFIIVSRPIRFPFPALEDFLETNYRFNTAFLDLYVYESISPTPPPSFNVNY